VALFDIRGVDTDAQPYCACASHDVLSTAKGEKKCKYLLPKVRRSANTCRPVRIGVPGLFLCVCL